MTAWFKWLVGAGLMSLSGSALAALPPNAVSVQVRNPLATSRQSETIAIGLADLRRLVAALDPQHSVVLDVNAKVIDSQWVDMTGDDAPDELVFQSDFGPNEVKTFVVQNGERKTPGRDQYRVYGRFVRERHDDFAWENDRVAHRMYGPDLETWKAEPLTSSGVDVWVKRVPRRVINDWYLVDDYHRDNGEGGDFYSVGKSRGCGGLGVWSAGDLFVSHNFVASRVLANGPLRLVFELDYAPWEIGGGNKVRETKRVILDAGQSFGRFESRFSLDHPAPLVVGVGIAKHAGASHHGDPKRGAEQSFEPFKDGNGNLGCAVVLDRAASGQVETASDWLLVTDVPASAAVRYFVGTAWDRSGQVKDAADWAKRVDAFSREAKNPPIVRLAGTTGLPLSRSDPAASSWATRLCETTLQRAPDVFSTAWSYDNGLVLSGFLATWKKTGNRKYFDYVKRTIDGLIDGDGTIKGYRLEDYNLDQINSGKLLFTLLERATSASDRERYRRALTTLRGQLRTQPRTRDGGFWHKSIYPHQMWLDGLYMAAPFLAEYAAAFREPALFDEAAKQILLLEKHTRDPQSGLLYHGWDESRTERWANPKTGTSSEFWGRSLGWYSMALVDVLEFLPKSHARRQALLGALERVADALLRVQDPATGVWWQVLDKGGSAMNYREASASAMVVYALSKAVNQGWLDPARYAAVAERGFRGMLQAFVSVGAQGAARVNEICKVAGLGGKPYRDGSYQYYATGTEHVTDDPKGLGAFILASAQRD